jgi:hypothetical protein
VEINMGAAKIHRSAKRMHFRVAETCYAARIFPLLYE